MDVIGPIAFRKVPLTEVTSLHSITLSARQSGWGQLDANVRAMRRLILRSNLVGRSNGKSLGFAQR
jgi:hypothetical protein